VLCHCPHCQTAADRPDKALHRQMNVLLSRLDEQQRRWYVALEANRLGPEGVRWLALITGLDEKTIRRGQTELTNELADRPTAGVRLPGGGRPTVEKKIRRS
jgi:hypothetical protein